MVFGWVVGAPLLASGDRAIWLILELAYAATRWALSTALLPYYGATAVGMGLLISVVLLVALNVGAIRWRYKLLIGWR